MKKLINISYQDSGYLLLFIVLVVVMFMSVQTSAEPKYNSLIEIEVAEGDTLWAIASYYSDDVSIHAYLLDLRNYNDIQNDRIYPGQKLVVPTLEMQKVVNSEESDNLLSSKY
jgi:LysM repeat protein